VLKTFQFLILPLVQLMSEISLWWWPMYLSVVSVVPPELKASYLGFYKCTHFPPSSPSASITIHAWFCHSQIYVELLAIGRCRYSLCLLMIYTQCLLNKWIDGWTNEWMDEWMNEKDQGNVSDAWSNKYFSNFILHPMWVLWMLQLPVDSHEGRVPREPC
jgi:hypothetical protein